MASSNLNECLYDEVRDLFVVKTKEEVVRQRLLYRMIHSLGYPKELLGVEVALSLFSLNKVPRRRLDIVCFKTKKDLEPLLIIECKRALSLQERAFGQAWGYNCFVQAEYVAVAHPEGEMVSYRTQEGLCYLAYLPPYKEMI